MSWPHALQHGFALSFGVGCGSGTEGAKSNYNKIVKPDVLGKLEINFSKFQPKNTNCVTCCIINFVLYCLFYEQTYTKLI